MYKKNTVPDSGVRWLLFIWLHKLNKPTPSLRWTMCVKVVTVEQTIAIIDDGVPNG